MPEKERLFNQREILELQQIITEVGIPMFLKVDSSDKSIDLDFKGEVYIQSILKKSDKGYRSDYTNSNGENHFVEQKEWNSFKYFIKKWIEEIKRDNPFEPIRKNNIVNISSKFYSIFREASVINQIGFKDSSGMIFRKALEVLVKDFLKVQFPKNYENFLNRKTIGQIIHHFYDIKDEQLVIKEKFKDIRNELDSLRSLANIIKNTFQIGNDFSHYERRLTEFSAKNMSDRITKIADYVDCQIELKKLVKKQTEMNKEFDTDKL